MENVDSSAILLSFLDMSCSALILSPFQCLMRSLSKIVRRLEKNSPTLQVALVTDTVVAEVKYRATNVAKNI